MEAAGRALAEAAAEVAPAGPGEDRLRQGQQRRRRARRGSSPGRGRARGRGAAAVAARRALRRRRREPRTFPGDGPRARRRRGRGALAGSGVVVDAIFGTGFYGAPREPAAAAIAAINACGAPVVAADIASGVDASTGEVAGAAVEADLTVSFHAAKLGHWVAPGKRHTGELRVAAIGIPDGAPGAGARRPDPPIGARAARPAGAPTRPSSAPARCWSIGGSRGLTGAVVHVGDGGVAGRRRLRDRRRSGRARADLRDQADRGDVDRLSERRRRTCARRPPTPILEAAERAAAVVLGPGLGRDDGRARARAELAAAYRRAAGDRRRRPQRSRRAARAARRARSARPCSRRTPASSRRLLEVDSGRDRRRTGSPRATRGRRARGRRSSCSRATTRSSPRRRAAPIVNGLSSPALATAGTGDVLSGMIAALIARGLEPRTAAAAAVHAHTRAGRVAAERVGAAESVIATDVIAAIPQGLRPGAGEPVRATAVIDTGAVERNCRRLASGLSGDAELCAVVKADGYGHGAVPCAAAALAGGATWLAVAAAAEAAELRARARRAVPDPGARRADAGGARHRARAPAPISPSGARDSSTLVVPRRRRARRQAPGPRQVRQRHGPAGRARRRRGRASWPAPRPPRRELDLAGLWTHFATADDPGLDLLRPAARALPRLRAAASRPSSATCSCTPPTAPRPCASPPRISTWSAAASPSTASTRSAPTRSLTASSRRSSCAPMSPT